VELPLSSITGLSLVPRLEARLWIMTKLGFSKVEVVRPPADAYEQLAAGKRMMMAGYLVRT